MSIACSYSDSTSLTVYDFFAGGELLRCELFGDRDRDLETEEDGGSWLRLMVLTRLLYGGGPGTVCGNR